MIYAVKKAALFSFSDMIRAHDREVEAGTAMADFHQTDWDGNSAWHAIALYLGDNEFRETGGWLNELNELLRDRPNLHIDWSLPNANNQTPHEIAVEPGKSKMAAWIQNQGADSRLSKRRTHDRRVIRSRGVAPRCHPCHPFDLLKGFP